MDKYTVVYTYNGIQYDDKKECTTNICNSMDESGRYYAEWSKPVSKGRILYDHMRYQEQSNS